MMALSFHTWVRFLVWFFMGIKHLILIQKKKKYINLNFILFKGIIVYFLYGIRHSVEGKNAKKMISKNIESNLSSN